MAHFRQPISNRLALNTLEGHPGGLGVTVDNGASAVATTFLSPEEVDQLVLHALGMTKPEDLDPNAEEDYAAAMEAVRIWQATRASRESLRQLDSERNQIVQEAGFTAPWGGLPTPTRRLVDHLIEARKAVQK